MFTADGDHNTEAKHREEVSTVVLHLDSVQVVNCIKTTYMLFNRIELQKNFQQKSKSNMNDDDFH